MGGLRLPSGFHSTDLTPSTVGLRISYLTHELRRVLLEPIQHVVHCHRRPGECGCLLSQRGVDQTRCPALGISSAVSRSDNTMIREVVMSPLTSAESSCRRLPVSPEGFQPAV